MFCKRENHENQKPAIKTTADLRDHLAKLRERLENGEISNAVARTLLNIARGQLDTLKVEMMAKNLGEFGPVAFDVAERALPAQTVN